MSDAGAPEYKSCLGLVEPFHGAVGLGVWWDAYTSTVRVVVSVDKGWDVDLLIEPADAKTMAERIGNDQLVAVTGRTVDGEPAVLVVENDRLAITVPRMRLSDLLILGEQSDTVRNLLKAATGG